MNNSNSELMTSDAPTTDWGPWTKQAGRELNVTPESHQDKVSFENMDKQCFLVILFNLVMSGHLQVLKSVLSRAHSLLILL